MTDALTHEVLLPEAASEAAPVAATDAASVAARVAAPTLGPAERIEVMLSSDRRREHPPELRARLVAEMMTSRTPVSVIARREGICASVLHRWQRRARTLAGLPVPNAPPRLLPVRVEAPAPETSRAAAGLEVVLGNGRVLRVPAGADPAQVARIAAALEGQNRRRIGAVIALPPGARVWLAAGATDMRRGFDGLARQVQHVLGHDPFNGHLFVFRGKRGCPACSPNPASKLPLPSEPQVRAIGR